MSNTKASIHESFVVIAPSLYHEVETVVGRLKDLGLTIEKRIEIPMSSVEAETVLSSITKHLRKPAPAVPIEEVRARKFGLATSRTFGAESFAKDAAVPSLEDVEAFSAGGTPTILVVGSIDPRRNVVESLRQLVGPDDRAEVKAARNCLREVFDSRTHQRVWRVAAPVDAESASRGLALVRRLHDAATGHAGTMRPASSSLTGTPSRSMRRQSLSLTGSNTSSVGAMGLLASLTLAGPFPAGATQGKGTHVDVDQLLDFVFPPKQQWPNSTGRLILYGLYGPLTATGGLNGGRRGGRNLTERELETMIGEIERDDMLAVYAAGSVLGDIGQLLTDVRAASRRLPNMSREQVIGMLADLPRDGQGRVAFHDVQHRVLRARGGRVQELGKMFPDVISQRDPDVARMTINPAPLPYGKGTLHVRLTEEAALGETIAQGGQAAALATVGLGSFRALMAAKDTQRRAASAGATRRGHAGADHHHSGAAEAQRVTFGVGTGAPALFPAVSTLTRRVGRDGKLATGPRSPTRGGNASPTRHPRAQGGIDSAHSGKLGDVQRARMMESLLHRNVSLVSTVDQTGTATATAAKASSMILRPDLPSAQDGFNRFAPLAMHKPSGSAVPGALTRNLVRL